MYWTEYNAPYPQGAGLGNIKRANLDGTGLVTLVKGLNYPIALALDIGALAECPLGDTGGTQPAQSRPTAYVGIVTGPMG